MTVAEIKAKYRLADVLRGEGVEVNRAGFCHCIYHKERTPSMRIYDHSFYSFCCGRSGDVIDFVRQLHGLSFQDACIYLTGEKAGSKTNWAVGLSKMRQKDREKRVVDRRRRLWKINVSISFWRRCMELADEFSEPMSEDWCRLWGPAHQKYEYYCYLQDELLRESESDHR